MHHVVQMKNGAYLMVYSPQINMELFDQFADGQFAIDTRGRVTEVEHDLFINLCDQRCLLRPFTPPFGLENWSVWYFHKSRSGMDAPGIMLYDNVNMFQHVPILPFHALFSDGDPEAESFPNLAEIQQIKPTDLTDILNM